MNAYSSILILSLTLQDYRVFVRDLTAVLPYLVIFLRLHREALSRSLRQPRISGSVKWLLVSVGDIFHCWFSSQVIEQTTPLTFNKWITY